MGSVDMGPAGTGAAGAGGRWGESGQSPAESMLGERVPANSTLGERASPLSPCRERVPAASTPGERAFTPSPRWERDSPRCIYAGRAPCLRPCRGPHVTPLTPWTGGKGRDRRARPCSVLNGQMDRFPARESEPLTPGWGWVRRVESLRLYSLPRGGGCLDLAPVSTLHLRAQSRLLISVCVHTQ